jgi:ergothioneine biosynthesis protein EgtB
MQRSELVQYFKRVREVSEDICRPLQIEDYIVQPIEDVSPPKWHLGHTSWFYEAMFLEKYLANYKPYHPKYSFLFNSYYQTFGERWDRPNRGVLSRPTVKEVYEYRNAITDRMVELIEEIKEDQYTEFANLLVLSLNHEQQHQELLVTDIKYILAVNPLYPVYQPKNDNPRISSPLKSEFIPFKAGVHQIGHNGHGFCYDNEQPVHSVFVNDFQLHNRLVANGEFLEFIEDGGYQDFRHWLSDGWDTVQRERWQTPLHWKQIDNEWYEITLSGLKKLDPATPVCHVSFYEAEAYASWQNKRLPSEAEWEVAARKEGLENAEGNLWDNKNYHPIAFTKSKMNGKHKLFQMIGDVWEWTNSGYLPYPGYKQAEGALGEYNGKFMINQMVLRGGSCATSKGHARITYRNFFQPDKRWQFTGIRLADDNK